MTVIRGLAALIASAAWFSNATYLGTHGEILLFASQPFQRPPYCSRKPKFSASDVGLGLRLDLPIGPLRIDYAFPIQTPGPGMVVRPAKIHNLSYHLHILATNSYNSRIILERKTFKQKAPID